MMLTIQRLRPYSRRTTRRIPRCFRGIEHPLGHNHQELSEASENPGVVEALVENHRGFLAFLERRGGSRAQAEDILQAAFVRGIEKAGSIRDAESAVA